MQRAANVIVADEILRVKLRILIRLLHSGEVKHHCVPLLLLLASLLCVLLHARLCCKPRLVLINICKSVLVLLLSGRLLLDVKAKHL